MIYRHISGPADEGPDFLRVLDDIAHFYVHDMRGRVREDGPGVRMKFTRDWEYPWTFVRANVGPGQRVLDCGAGYSPLPFLWARAGATAHAIDRDAVVASGPKYAAWCVARMVEDVAADLRRHLGRARPAANGGTFASATPPSSDGRPSVVRRFFRSHVARNRDRLRRLWKPDFWGPVSPALLRRYGVHYERGDLTSLPFASDSFDAVTCVSVLEHMPEPARLRGLRDMARVLRPGGRLVVTYDLIDGDLTESLVSASGCEATELVYFHASDPLFTQGSPDVVGMALTKNRLD